MILESFFSNLLKSHSNLNWFFLFLSDSARGIFGAPFGFQSNLSEGFCIVAIRNLYWDGRQTKLYSGCGIVEKSQIKKEWKELEVKRNSVKQMLGL